jgi:EmrB/QacA subfamily drug resistance transporter
MIERRAAAIVVYTGAINAALANNVVNVAFPVFADEFQTSPAVVVWIAIAYTLTNSSLATTFGRLSDMRGRRSLYALGLGIFLVGSLLCATSGSIQQLIGFRILQGVGSAMVNANSMAYLIEIYPPNRRGAIVGLWEACIGAGIAVGPIIGGGLLSAFGWRSVFFVSVPLAIVILLLIPRYMFEPVRQRRQQHFDVAGAALFAGGVSTLLYALSESYAFGWGSPVILGCLAVSVACGAGFIRTELRTRQPMVDLNMFRNWTFSAGNLAKVFAYLPFSASTFMLPFYLEQALGFTPATVGLSLTPLPVGMVAASLVFGPLSDRIGARRLAPAGAALQGLAALAFTQVRPEQGLGPLLLIAMFLSGVGMGAFIAPNDSSILSVTPAERLGVANGIMGISRQFGLVLGYSVAAGLLAARLQVNAGDFGASFREVYAVISAVAFVAVFLAAARQRRPAPALAAA